jgi:hypothetical protein
LVKNYQVNKMATTVTAGTGGVNVQTEVNVGGIWNAIWNESPAFMNMPQTAKDEAKVYKNRLSEAVNEKNVPAAKTALKSLANLYEKQSKLAGVTTEQGRELQQLATNCRSAASVLTKDNIQQLNQNRGNITQNTTGNDGSSNDANGALITAFADSNGKVDLNKAKDELEKAGYTKEEIASFEKACNESNVVKETTLTTASKSKDLQAQA